MKPSPKQTVINQFGSRAKLVQEIVGLLADDKDSGTESRLNGAKNSQLLRIHSVLTAVKDQFGNKKNLVNAIAEKKFSGRKPTQGYTEKLETYSQKRLYDLYTQVSGKSS
ncbi:MAG: hypothetical protein CMH54_05445 [Myxococcales bacterium]|nr:hypothetical protein [Myxococcales bacterium]|tara:strand:- start:604 stop:933 length:330 start_codon:yes stop_codon:yes gene_type:complete